ncbi:MAG: hypothetical protein LBU61_05705 [Coriobacteriales bacterium]|jgi:hypothetical protein|nr:hypothetical protein [Coriobacteriales bacterium]
MNNTIISNVVREKVHRKDLYIIAAFSILITLMMTGNQSTLTINGEPLTGYTNMLTITILLIGLAAGALTIALSSSTIPNEYNRGTSHLIWIRGVKQSIYHASLAVGSLTAALIALGLLLLAPICLMLANNQLPQILRLPVACLLMALPIAIICLLVSGLSIRLPGLATGLFGASILIIGYAHPLLSTWANLLSGTTSTILRSLLLVVPDLYSLQMQSLAFLCGEDLAWHNILGGLLGVYLLAQLFLLLKRKQA